MSTTQHRQDVKIMRAIRDLDNAEHLIEFNLSMYRQTAEQRGFTEKEIVKMIPDAVVNALLAVRQARARLRSI